jgi:hypothetical protein
MLETTLRITNSADTGISGLTSANIKFRRGPFGSGDEITIAGVSGGTNGIYLCSFIGVPYQAAQLWIDGVYQSDWGTKYIGDVFEEFLSKDITTEQDIVSDIDMNSKKLKNLADGSGAADSMTYGQGVKATGAVNENIEGVKTYFSYPKIRADEYAHPSEYHEFTPKGYVDEVAGTGASNFTLQANRILVDSKLAANSTGKKYSTIQAAIAYAATQTPTSANRFTIFIVPHHSSGYAENVTLIRFCDLAGLGNVVITGSMDTTHGNGGSSDYTGYDTKLKNITFAGVNTALEPTGLKADNCIFKVNGSIGETNFLINSCQFDNCGFYIQNDVNIEIQNTPVTGKINRVNNCKANFNPLWHEDDKIYSLSVISGDIWEL